jgi:succinate dehydrogenase/fumarate reductase flavoprotein subunit
MALRVGAELVDMEMVQCLPTCFLWPKAWQGIEFPLGFVHYQNVGWLLNKTGERFMKKWDPKREESTTRDVLTVGVMDEILKGNTGPHGGIYLSLAHMPRDLIEYIDVWWGPPKKGPEDRWMMQGISFAELMDKVEQGESMEVGPAVHFHMGGIKINEKCETNLRGLFAAGECAGGLHGANRLSGNATTQILVQGEVAGRFAAEIAKKSQHIEIDESQVENLRKKVYSPLERAEGTNPLDLKKRMHKVAWENVGVLRESWRLKSALEDIEKMRKEVSNIVTTSKDRIYNKEWMVAIQMENMLMVLEVVARSALMRTESRGAHYRKDFPNIDYDNWNKNIVVKQVDSRMELSTNPLAITKFQPPKGVQPYPGD